MSIFSSIADKVFHSAQGASSSQPEKGHFSPTLSGTSIPGQPDLSAKPVSPVNQNQSVDVNALLSGMAQKSKSTLNWKASIVDLLKLLDLDSSLNARIALAKELKYPGDTQDSAKMNVWLHQKVMENLALNSGHLSVDAFH